MPPAQPRAPLPHCCVLQAHFWGMYQSEAVVPGSALQGQKLNPVLVPACVSYPGENAVDTSCY